MPTIKDVAREAGVSIATVSYVLNHKTDAVSDETRRLVWEAVERIGYTPNITARNLQASKSRLIGYAWHEAPRDQVNSVLDRFTYFLAQSAEAAGYHILTFTYPSDDPLPVYEDLIRTGRVDGFVVSGTRLNDERIAALMQKGVPFVSFGRSTPSWPFTWVDTDGAAGLRIAVQHVAELGHTRIGFLGWPPPSLAGEHREAGFREGLIAAGLPLNEDLIWYGDNSEDTGRVVLRRWLALPAAKRPTAVLAVSDLMAIGLLNEADQHGVEIGRELSVVGFDDAPTSQYVRPPLTSLRQPIPDIAQAVISLLEARLNKTTRAPEHRLFVPRLIMRKSSGFAPD
ncbi:MAG TPA: LacI family DNA-binding transcriptional regulator [Candidatus Limnocylindrales bacterium]|nr:LacI family DNA-binding transcriptional regulator [Candidatus Limnocylindrales bacterium]